MPKYVIEREIPGVGNLSAAELRGISQKSCGVLQQMGSAIQWVESFVTDDKIYCVYVAPSEAMVREHAKRFLRTVSGPHDRPRDVRHRRSVRARMPGSGTPRDHVLAGRR